MSQALSSAHYLILVPLLLLSFLSLSPLSPLSPLSSLSSCQEVSSTSTNTRQPELKPDDRFCQSMLSRQVKLTRDRVARIVRGMASSSSSNGVSGDDGASSRGTLAPSSTAAPLAVLVTGANGKQGRAVCEGLLALHAGSTASQPRPLQIRAMVRDASSARSRELLALPQKHGTQRHASLILTQADMTDPGSLTQALESNSGSGNGPKAAVEVVFLNTVPTFNDAQEEVRRASAVLAAARAAGSVRHVVYSSVVGLADPELLDRIGGLPDWARDEVTGESVASSLGPADFPPVEKVPVRSGLSRNGENAIPSSGQGRRLLQGYFGAKAQIEHLTKTWSRTADGSSSSSGGGGDKTWTVLRPGWFMDNFLPPGLSNYWPELAGARPVLRSATSPRARIMLVDPADIGLVAAHAMLSIASPNLANKTVNVGSQAVGVEQAAAILSAAAGVHIPAESLSESEAVAEIRAGNLQRDVQAWNTETQDCFEPAELAPILGRSPTTFEHFLGERRAELQAFFGR